MPECEFRVLVTGGRDYDNRERLFQVLDKAFQAATLSGKSFTLVHGGARGADTLADVWATDRKIADEGGVVRVYAANWERDRKAAGPIRNKLMLTKERPNVIIAFKGGNGTAHMMKIGRAAGVHVLEVEDRMSDLINEIARKVYNTKIYRKPASSYITDTGIVDETIVVDKLDVKLIVMSRYTYYEVCKLDYSGYTGITAIRDKTEPYRMFGIRVAFDDSLSLGNVLVAGEVA